MVNDGKDDFNVYQFDTKEPKIDKKKLTFIILIILGIICILLICNNISNTMRSYQVYKQYEAQILTLNQQEVERKQQEEAKKEQEKNSFNNKFSFKSGTSSKTSVGWTLDDVMTNNKTNKEHLIEVIYKDKSYGTTYDEIIKIKSLLKDFDGYNLVHYEVSFEYNDAGYIYKMIIK